VRFLRKQSSKAQSNHFKLFRVCFVRWFLRSKAAKRKATILNSFGYVLSDGFLEAKQQSAKQPFKLFSVIHLRFLFYYWDTFGIFYLLFILLIFYLYIFKKNEQINKEKTITLCIVSAVPKKEFEMPPLLLRTLL
jgi:hypothetical protein